MSTTGLGTQVEAEKGVGRVGVGSYKSAIVWRENAGHVQDGIERTFVLRILLVDGERIHGQVFVDDRESIDVRILGDLARLIGTYVWQCCGVSAHMSPQIPARCTAAAASIAGFFQVPAITSGAGMYKRKMA